MVKLVLQVSQLGRTRDHGGDRESSLFPTTQRSRDQSPKLSRPIATPGQLGASLQCAYGADLEEKHG
jgi:hypothetical protein